MLWFFFGVEVVEIAVELIESMDRREELVTVAKVVLPKLPGRIAQRFEQFRERGVFGLNTDLCPGKTYFCQAGTNRTLARDKGGSPRRATLLGVVVREHHSVAGQAVDVRRLVSDQSATVGAEVGDAHVVAHDDEDVGPLRLARGVPLHGPSLVLGECLGGAAYQRPYRDRYSKPLSRVSNNSHE